MRGVTRWRAAPLAGRQRALWWMVTPLSPAVVQRPCRQWPHQEAGPEQAAVQVRMSTMWLARRSSAHSRFASA